MKRVLLGMSGGVDSSVSAILLKEAGYEVIGATMKLWESPKKQEESLCCSLDAVYDAKRVCDILEIPHYTLNFKEEFRQCVIHQFIESYQKAETPNPCVECNRYLKFHYFYEKAKQLECDYIATGHYAKQEFSTKYNQYVLKKSNADKKDQTYFLYNIPKDVIPNMLFPLQDFTDKSQIRQIAEEQGLTIAKKPDSQEICFIPDSDYVGFLLENMKEKPKEGNIVNSAGKVLGKHKGLIYYTIGQRKGLGISYPEPLYAIRLDIRKNEVIVGTEKELYQRELVAKDVNLLTMDQLTMPMQVKAKIRYRAKEADATIYPLEQGNIKVVFEEPQRAITPGQSVVFYQDDVVIGGGKIVGEEN